jgi:hypothetical protein
MPTSNAIILSVLLQFAASDCPLIIFKLVLVGENINIQKTDKPFTFMLSLWSEDKGFNYTVK